MTELIMRKRGGRLEPVDVINANDLAALPSDKDLLVTVKAPKNLKQLRWMWVLAQKVADAVDGIHDKDDAMDLLCERARHVKMVVSPVTGHLFLVRKSLSKLDGAALSRLMNRMVYVTCAEIIPGLDEGQLRDEIEAMVAPREREPA